MTYAGGCHCRAIGIEFASERPVREWPIRSCACSFCRAHGARYTSDPTGEVRLLVRDSGAVVRYSFASRSAEFVMCGRCGVYLGAVTGAPGPRLGVVNVNALDVADVPEATRVSFDGEDVEQRRLRRHRTWTPLVEIG